MNSTDIFLVEGTTVELCIELIHPTNLESLEQMRLIQIISNGQDSQGHGHGGKELD